ncbi:MAG: LytTR family transcriptional regulator DNA-binding domain-containing protein, partial [Geminicoccales bacterium]
GMAASGLALWLANGRGGRPPLLLSATALGTAIAGMHYTAMAGLTVTPFAGRAHGAPALSSDLLAIVVALVAFIVSGIFLLALVPERSRVAARPMERPTPALQPGRASASDAIVSGTPADDVAADRDAAAGHAAFGSLDGAAAPPRRTAQRLPVEREGITQFVPVDDIVAVHANAHYTYVFDGKARLFCPLAISVVESRLDNARFIRVHRSHIVNIDRNVGLRRAGDTGLIELAALDPYTVPVSRSRLGWLKSHLGLKPGDVGRDHPIVAAEPAVLAAQHR